LKIRGCNGHAFRNLDEGSFEIGSGEPQKDFVADLTIEKVKTIAEQKSPTCSLTT
jgi:ribosomal protein L11